MQKSLTEQLNEAQKLAEYWKGKYDALYRQMTDEEEKKREERHNVMGSFVEQGRELLSLNQQLMEVVRWHVNPETAKKDPVDDMRNRRMY